MFCICSGLGIRSSVFERFAFLVSERVKERFAHKKEQIAHGHSFFMSDLSESLTVALLS